MKPDATIIMILGSASEDDARLEELGDELIEAAASGKVEPRVIEALFKIHERLHDPNQNLFNALEACAMGPLEPVVRKLALESAKRKPNFCNLQLTGAGPDAVKTLKDIAKRPGLDEELRDQIQAILAESQST